MSMHVEIYREKVRVETEMFPPGSPPAVDYVAKGDWRWRFVFGNGLTGANGGEGYKRKPAMLRSMALVLGGTYREKSKAYVDSEPFYECDCIERPGGTDTSFTELIEIRVVEA